MATLTEIEKYAKKSLKKHLNLAYQNRSLKKKVGGVSEWFVDLSICSAPKMTKLNHEFRGKKKPTDVLSFPLAEVFQNQGYLGDLVICGPVLLKQAKEMKHSWKAEADVLIVHGILHLLGFDHELGDQAAKEMAKWEQKLLAAKAKKNSLISRSRV